MQVVVEGADASVDGLSVEIPVGANFSPPSVVLHVVVNDVGFADSLLRVVVLQVVVEGVEASVDGLCVRILSRDVVFCVC